MKNIVENRFDVSNCIFVCTVSSSSWAIWTVQGCRYGRSFGGWSNVAKTCTAKAGIKLWEKIQNSAATMSSFAKKSQAAQGWGECCKIFYWFSYFHGFMTYLQWYHVWSHFFHVVMTMAKKQENKNKNKKRISKLSSWYVLHKRLELQKIHDCLH